MPQTIDQSEKTDTCIDHALHEDLTETTLLPLPLPKTPVEEEIGQDLTKEESLRNDEVQSKPLRAPLRSDRVGTDPATQPPSNTSGNTLT